MNTDTTQNCQTKFDLTDEEYELIDKNYYSYVERLDSFSFAPVEIYRQSAIDHMEKEGLIIMHDTNPRMFKLTEDGYNILAFGNREGTN